MGTPTSSDVSRRVATAHQAPRTRAPPRTAKRDRLRQRKGDSRYVACQRRRNFASAAGAKIHHHRQLSASALRSTRRSRRLPGEAPSFCARATFSGPLPRQRSKKRGAPMRGQGTPCASLACCGVRLGLCGQCSSLRFIGGKEHGRNTVAWSASQMQVRVQVRGTPRARSEFEPKLRTQSRSWKCPQRRAMAPLLARLFFDLWRANRGACRPSRRTKNISCRKTDIALNR
jgi:hypothetical protein